MGAGARLGTAVGVTTRTAGAGKSAADAVGSVGVAVRQPDRRMESTNKERRFCIMPVRRIKVHGLFFAIAEHLIRVIVMGFAGGGYFSMERLIHYRVIARHEKGYCGEFPIVKKWINERAPELPRFDF